MPRSRRRFLALALGASLALPAGCIADSGESPRSGSSDPPTEPATESPTDERTPRPTTLPPTTVAFPVGPKERPEKPDDLTAESVREYVRTHEYNLAYNRLWHNEYSEVDLTCEVVGVERPGDFYRVQVSCTGSSNTGGERGNETATVVHADWFTQEFVYLVDEDATIRRRPDEKPTTTG